MPLWWACFTNLFCQLCHIQTFIITTLRQPIKQNSLMWFDVSYCWLVHFVKWYLCNRFLRQRQSILSIVFPIKLAFWHIGTEWICRKWQRETKKKLSSPKGTWNFVKIERIQGDYREKKYFIMIFLSTFLEWKIWETKACYRFLPAMSRISHPLLLFNNDLWSSKKVNDIPVTSQNNNVWAK